MEPIDAANAMRELTPDKRNRLIVEGILAGNVVDGRYRFRKRQVKR